VTIAHPIPAGTTVDFKVTGKRDLQRGVVSKAFLLGTKTWNYAVRVGDRDWAVIGAAIVNEEGRPAPREDGWDEFP
jgi:hypothetical protein